MSGHRPTTIFNQSIDYFRNKPIYEKNRTGEKDTLDT